MSQILEILLLNMLPKHYFVSIKRNVKAELIFGKHNKITGKNAANF